MSGERVSFAAGTHAEDAAARAVAAFRRDGVVVLDDFAEPVAVERCRRAIERDQPGYDQPDPARNFGLYPGRFTVPLHADQALADRQLLCPVAALDVLERLLDDAFVMDSFGLLVSLPGTTDQTRHADAVLFPKTPIDRLLPPVAVALAMPLVRMDEVSGSTGFWCGSHRDPTRGGEQDFAPTVPVGSALLWDFRVFHRGLANRGDRPRPVLFSVFCRDWWSEVVDPGAIRHEKLTIARSVREGLDRRTRRVMQRACVVD